MKKLLLSFLILGCLIPHAFAFRDVPKHSTIYPAVQHLVDKGLLEDDGRFFRASQHVPAGMFWEIVIRDSGFDPNSATFNTPLPPNIAEEDPLAQFLREAIRRKFIDFKRPFEADRHVTKSTALKTILTIKAIPVSNKNSSQFRRLVGSSIRSSVAPYVEAALASKMFEESDLAGFGPYTPLTRRDLARWLYHHAQNGSLKKSTLSTPTPSSVRENSRQRRSNRLQQRSSQPKTAPKGNTLRIEVINGRESEVRSGSQGLHIPNGRIFESVFSEIENNYRFTEDIDTKKKERMIDAAIRAMVKELGDKYSTYIEPSKSEDFRQGLDGQFEGIGAYVEMIEDKFTITSPITGSPAEEAGIQAGDIVTHVDDESVEGMPISDIIDKVKGPAGTKVRLTINRGGSIHKITVTRGKITIPSITLKWENSVPVVGIHQFARDTHVKFDKMLQGEILPKKPRGLIIDLRNNPGGFLTSAVSMGQFFLNQGDLIFTVEERNNTKKYTSPKKGPLVGFKNVVVLTNKGSASASEILAGMIQDYGIGKIVGTKTLGKGSVQSVQNYSNGGILKLTIAKWLTPKGRWINDTGVEPDIVVEDPTPEEKKAKVDRQLERAVAEVLGR